MLPVCGDWTNTALRTIGKNNKGVKGNNGGRKSKAEELKVSAYATDAIASEYGSIEAFWKFMAEQSRMSKDHLFKLLEYAYGKPHQQVDANVTLTEIIVDFDEDSD